MAAAVVSTSARRGRQPGQPWHAVLARRDWWRLGGMAGTIALLHVVGFGVLLAFVVPKHVVVGKQAFGLGLGITAYTLGMRHAFDADHISAIDNTTRKLISEGKKPLSVGYWFSLGHSTVVFVAACALAGGAKIAGQITNDNSSLHQITGTIGASVSGTFLYVIAALNVVILMGILRMFRDLRHGKYDEATLEQHLNNRGFMNRFFGKMMRSITKEPQIYPVGVLFGIGFDTATEVALLVLAGTGAASGVPWYGIVILPILFAAGMCLFDTMDGAFMNFAYDWAFARPVRKIYYNLTVTALSIFVAFVIGTIELIGVFHDQAHFVNPVTTYITNINLNNVGYVIVGVFVAVWALALVYWKLGRVEERWTGGAKVAAGG